MALPDLAAPPSRRLLEHALLLIARQHGGDAATAQAAREQLAQWRGIAPAHEAAALAAQRAWSATEATALQGSLPLPPSATERSRQTRRRMLSVLGVAALALAVGTTSRWYWLQPLEQVALHTGRAQQAAHTLQDGSQIDLAPHTDARAMLYRHRREVRLAQGEIRVEVQPDAARPFTVLTDWGRVRVLGTGFTVAVHGQRMTVAVAHGRVAVWADGDDSASGTRLPDVELAAGERVQAQDGRLGAVQAVTASDVGAWRQGWLVFDRTPLPEAVARWNDYLAQPLVLADDPALQRLQLTGSFQLRDPGAFIGSLPAVLPVQVQVERSAHGGAHIRARP